MAKTFHPINHFLYMYSRVPPLAGSSFITALRRYRGNFSGSALRRQIIILIFKIHFRTLNNNLWNFSNLWQKTEVSTKILYFSLRCNFFKNSHFKNNLITVQPEKVLRPWPVFFSGRIFERPVRIPQRVYIYIYTKSLHILTYFEEILEVARFKQ
jgi:hypothetical protein